MQSFGEIVVLLVEISTLILYFALLSCNVRMTVGSRSPHFHVVEKKSDPDM